MGRGHKERRVVDDVALANYRLGSSFDNVDAGSLDSFLARLLGVKPGTTIWLSDYTFIKLDHKHDRLSFEHYNLMPDILLRGYVAVGRNANVLELWWADELQYHGLYGLALVLKATKRLEVFVETFHPIDRKEAGRLLRKACRENRLRRSQVVH